MISRKWAKTLVTQRITNVDAQGNGLKRHMEWTTVLQLGKFILNDNMTVAGLKTKLALMQTTHQEMTIKLSSIQDMADYLNGEAAGIAFLEELINDLEPTQTDLILWAQQGNTTKPGAYGKTTCTIETAKGIVDAGTKCAVTTVLPDNGMLVVTIIEAPGGVTTIPYWAFGKID